MRWPRTHAFPLPRFPCTVRPIDHPWSWFRVCKPPRFRIAGTTTRRIAGTTTRSSASPSCEAAGADGALPPVAGSPTLSELSPGGYLGVMSEVTQILCAMEAGDPRAASQLLPLVYDELRKLAAAHLADERPGQTLQPTALVHEAYLRLVGEDQPRAWDG